MVWCRLGLIDISCILIELRAAGGRGASICCGNRRGCSGRRFLKHLRLAKDYGHGLSSVHI